jgi:hypothetical protein
MVGEINVAIADQDFKVKFLGKDILLCFPNYRSAGKLAASAGLGMSFSCKLLEISQGSLFAKIGSKAFELWPKPSWLIRCFFPGFGKMVRGLSR